ncbi:MAG: hypothetical protein HGA38_00040 [Candidatus Moranbacteria bacterium]|nr:hypothetical protein [Candidatus Moranbacteria bacterium]
MYLPGTDNEIAELLNGLPYDVSRVLGLPEETQANASLVDAGILSGETLVRFSRFYLTIVAKRNQLRDIPIFLRDEFGMTDPTRLRNVLAKLAERLSWYGDYFPDLPSVAKEWGVPFSNGEPIIMRVRRDLAAEAAADAPVAVMAPSSIEKEMLPLLSAIGKYPKLGEQAITEERIRVKNQSEPVRASLANWIRVYRDELGIGYHEPMLRGKFIFDSENGKRLSAEERERLNLILRSMEENVPLEIDSSVPAIVFPEFSGSKSIASPLRPNVSAGTRSSSPLPVSSIPQQTAAVSHSGPIPPQAPARKPVSFVPTPPADLPIGGGSFSFSSSHALPVEAEQEGDFSIRRPTPPQAVPSGQSAFGVASPSIAQASAPDMAAPDLNPFHIHPVSARKAPLSVVQPGNVVDLRGGNRKQV